MKIVLLLCITCSVLAGGRSRIQNDDIIKKKSLTINVDGLELWDIPLEQREQARQDFVVKCYEEIPARSTNHYLAVEAQSEFFNFHDIHTTYNVVEKRYRNLGTQLICRNMIQTTRTSGVYFDADYSEVYSDRNGTMELCKEKIAQIDATAAQNGVLTRRAYFTYSRDRDGNVTFPKCQTLTIFLKRK